MERSFPGDHCRKLARVQHDVYFDRDTPYLGGLVWRCVERYRYAERLCQVTTALGAKIEELAARRSHDHRVLQDAHDLIAAWYRRNCRPWRPLFDPIFDPPLERELWLDFVEDQVRRLLESPSITRAVLTAVAYQNTDTGYAAEDELIVLLMPRYVQLFERRPADARGCLDECCPPEDFALGWRGRDYLPRR